MIGKGSRTLNWPRSVIRRAHDVLAQGTKLFVNHNEDNSTTGRRSVGSIVSKFTKEVGGKLQTIAIAAMEKADALIYDVCSIEANVQADETGYVGDIARITGIAVSNSKVSQPAFANAKRLAIVQCFDDPGERDNSRKETKMPITLEDLMTAPIGLMKQAVESRGMHPNQLFTEDAVMEDRLFGQVYKDKQEVESNLTNLQEEVKDLTEELKTTKKDLSSQSAGELLDELIPEKATELQKKFYKENFNPDTLETVDKESVEGYLKSSQEAFQKQAELFGYKDDGGNSGSDKTGDSLSLDEAFNEE